MSTPAHILSGAYIATVAAGVTPNESNHLLMAAVSGGILDLDHIYYFLRDWKYYRKNGFIGTMHKARSPLHELVGFTLAGTVMLILSFIDLKLAFVVGLPAMIHIVEDLLMGKSTPFAPVDMTEMHFLPEKKSTKMFIKTAVDITVVVAFSILWLMYLNVV
jgi:hypothetical protein